MDLATQRPIYGSTVHADGLEVAIDRAVSQLAYSLQALERAQAAAGLPSRMGASWCPQPTIRRSVQTRPTRCGHERIRITDSA